MLFYNDYYYYVSKFLATSVLKQQWNVLATIFKQKSLE